MYHGDMHTLYIHTRLLDSGNHSTANSITYRVENIVALYRQLLYVCMWIDLCGDLCEELGVTATIDYASARP